VMIQEDVVVRRSPKVSLIHEYNPDSAERLRESVASAGSDTHCSPEL
jgi:hypothetical protein